MSDLGDQLHREVRAAESRMEFALAGLLSLLVAGTLVYVHSVFEPLMPPAELWSWSIAMGLVTVLMMLVPVLVQICQPDAERIDRFWSPLGKLVAVLFDLAVAASVWMLLPYASEPLQLLMVIFYSAAISGQVLATAESTGTISFGVITVFGSAALFFLGSKTVYATSLALFLLAFGALLIGTAFVLKQAIRSAVTQRLRAETVSEQLAVALAQTNAERDARSRFIAAASHDLRQPLQAASLYIRQVPRLADPERRVQAVAGVQRGLDEALVMLEAMAEHLRLENGAMVAHVESVALAGIFAALRLELSPGARRAGIALRLHASSGAVRADPALLTRILRNLVTNAILHAQAGRVKVLVRRRAMVEIFVMDDGIGIGAGDTDRLFEPYAQGSGAQRLAHGSGLGLAIAREMAQLMGGSLQLDPRWQRGCAFVLRLPDAGRVPAPAQSGANSEAGSARALAHSSLPLAGRCILLVEDRADTRGAIAALLRVHGAQVHEAAGSAVAAHLLGDGLVPSDLVTDWHLGHADSGARVIGHARAAAPGIRVLVISGDATLATEAEVARLDVPLLLKPVSEPALLQALA